MTLFGLDLTSPAAMRAIAVIAIVIATFVMMRVVTTFVRRSMIATGIVPATSMVVNVFRAAVLVIGVLAILSVFDVSIAPILTALGVGGLAVSLALQDTLGNLFAGLQILATKQIRPGDYVLLDSGHEGTVVDIAWRTTTLRNPTDNLVIVPNAVLGRSIVTNFHLPVESVATTVEFGLAYGSDLDKAEKATREVAEQVMAEAGLDARSRPPIVRFKGFGEAQVVCAVTMFAPAYSEQSPLRSAFVKALHKRFAAEGISFPLPARSLHVAKS